jgi:hypothetical protein
MHLSKDNIQHCEKIKVVHFLFFSIFVGHFFPPGSASATLVKSLTFYHFSCTAGDKLL